MRKTLLSSGAAELSCIMEYTDQLTGYFIVQHDRPSYSLTYWRKQTSFVNLNDALKFYHEIELSQRERLIKDLESINKIPPTDFVVGPSK